MPELPRPALNADRSPQYAGASAWVEVLLFGIFCLNAGIGLANLANRLDAGRALGWARLASTAFTLTLAVALGVRLRRRLREPHRSA